MLVLACSHCNTDGDPITAPNGRADKNAHRAPDTDAHIASVC